MDQETIHRRRWAILASLVLSMLVVILDNTILNVALPSISSELGATQGQLTGAIMSYAVIFGALQFSAGVLGDRYGRRRLLVIGLIVFGLFSFLASTASTPEQLIVFRGFMAIGAALLTPQTLSIITNVFPPEERGKAIGIWGGMTGAGLGLGPVVGGLLLEHFWWGSIFFINVPIVIVGLALAFWIVPESKNPTPKRLDPLGIVLSAAGLGTLVFGLIWGGQYNEWASLLSTGMILLGIGLLALFAYHEANSDHPAFDVRFFKNPRFSAASLATALGFFAMFGLMFLVTFYYQFIRGLSPLQAGLCVLPIALAQMVLAPRAPKLVKRFGPKAVIAGGLITVAFSLLGWLFVTPETPLPYIFLLLTLTGGGMAHVVAPATESVMSSIPPQVAGAASAVNNTTRQVAGAFGIAVFSTVIQVVYANQIADSLDVLPEEAREEASRSLADTSVAIGRLAESDPAAAASASDVLSCAVGQACASGEAFMTGVHVISVLGFVFALLGAGVALKWLPREALAVAYGKRPGSGAPTAGPAGPPAGTPAAAPPTEPSKQATAPTPPE
jgi:DHA2 family multidrug resistance protein-like MFS transporter